MINILFIGPIDSSLQAHIEHHKNYLPFVSSEYNTLFVNTSGVYYRTYNVFKLVESFNNDCETILYFTAGDWLGNNGNVVIYHDYFFKIYEIWDQKIEKQYNAILKPYRFNAFIYRYDSLEIDTLKSWTPNMKHYNSYYYCNSNYYNDHGLEKKYDILFYGTDCIKSYPLRNRLKRICNSLHEKGDIVFRHIKPSEGIKEVRLSKEINRSYLTIACKTSSHDRLLGKYTEIPFSNSCIIGDIPSRYRELYRNKMVEIDLEMSDSEIIYNIMYSLQNKKKILEMSKRLRDDLIGIMDYHAGKKRFQEIIRDCVGL